MADKISIALLYNDYLIWFYEGYSLLCKMQIAIICSHANSV